eukprot:2100838-Alexandrium_andersonii.AAC.1
MAQEMAQNAFPGGFGDRFRGHSRACAVQAPNASSDLALYAWQVADWGGLQHCLAGWRPC